MATEADSVALVTSQNENLLRQESAESVGTGHLPVFEAFNELGLTGRDISEVAVVTAPTISKWRSGKVRIPDDRLVFLTLVLAHLLDDVQAISDLESEWNSDAGAGDWGAAQDARVKAARGYLALQDVLNRDLPVGDVRDGAKRFRTWWASGAAARLQEKRFRVALDGSAKRDLEFLKARVRNS